jgi:hypothetical protein
MEIEGEITGLQNLNSLEESTEESPEGSTEKVVATLRSSDQNGRPDEGQRKRFQVAFEWAEDLRSR